MHKFSRSLLFAGALAFGTLTACEGDTVITPETGVQSISVTPPSATINVGESISLAASVTADAATAKTVTWSTSSAATATVDATGKVTGVKAGNVTVTATSTADPSKAAAAAITVNAGPVVVNPTIAINSVTQGGAPANLLGAAGQLDVTVNTSGGGLIEAFLSTSCTTNAIAAGETAVASQQATSAQAGTVTLSFNTAQLTAAGAPRFPNGTYCIKTRLTNGTTVVVATNTVPLTLANVNSVTAALAFTSRTGGPTSGVSTINGLNYNQGDLTITITPVIFSSSSPAALISGSYTLNGEVNGAPVSSAIVFTNLAVTAGKATLVLTDTSLAGVNSIFLYTSNANGDTLKVASATDASGNPISLGSGVVAAAGVRIDNDFPLPAAAYTVTAPNGYIAGTYAFASGITNPAAADTKGGVPGVGGITTTWYVGLASAAAFTSTDPCNTSGLTAAATGVDLANTTATNVDKARVIVADKLGNRTCFDVNSTFPGGLFGVDKIAPTLSMTAGTANQTAGTDARDATGYNVTKNYNFVYSDTISGFDPAFPLKGTLTRNFFATGSDSAVNCVIGTYTAGKACTAVPMAGLIEFTNSTALSGYYIVTAQGVDRAGNTSASVTRIAAFDAVAPTAGAASVAASVVPLGAASISSAATDQFDLAGSAGRLTYGGLFWAPVAGTSFGPNFDATRVTSGTATVSLPNVYRGIQGNAGGVIQNTVFLPFGEVSVTDVGRNTATAALVAIPTTTASAAVQVGNSIGLAATSLAPATSQTTTTLTVTIVGNSADPAFQSQPFSKIDLYKLNAAGELVLVGTITATPSVTDTGAGVRTYTYTATGVALTAAATNQFYAIAVTTAGQAVLSPLVSIVNP